MLFPNTFIKEYEERFNRIKNKYKYKFEIDDIINCEDDENLFELIGYYIYTIFQNQQQDNLTKIKSSFEKQDQYNLFLYVFELKNDINIKMNRPLEIFVKEFIVDNYKYRKKIISEYLREYFVGMKISELRDEVPGFVFTFLYINENEIREIKDNEYTNDLYIDKEIYSNGLIFSENAGNYSFDYFIDNYHYNEEDVINIYLQVILSLNAINQYYEFSHNDLHLDNIMITELEEPKILTYNVKLNGKQVKINLKVDKYLAKIIDFGMSSIKYKYKNEEIFSYKLRQDFKYYEKDPFPENDIIKITSSFHNEYKINDKLLALFNKVIKIAVIDVEKHINNMKDNNYYMHYDNWNNTNYDKILNHIFEIFEDYIENPIFDKEKLVKCDSYIIRLPISKIYRNDKLDNITLDIYVKNIINNYIKNKTFNFDKKEIYYRLPYSFKYFSNTFYTNDKLELLAILEIILKKHENKNFSHVIDITIISQYIYNSIVDIMYNIKEYEMLTRTLLIKTSKFIDIAIFYGDINKKYGKYEKYEKYKKNEGYVISENINKIKFENKEDKNKVIENFRKAKII